MAGAHRAAELVPADAVVTVPVLDTGAEKVAGIRALDVLVENQRLTQKALAGIDDRVITVGGDLRGRHHADRRCPRPLR
jgi:arginase